MAGAASAPRVARTRAGPAARRLGGWWTGLGLTGIALAVVALRLVGLERVFPAGGPVVLEIGDGAYHARVAAHIFANFPHPLTFDSYLAGPLGGPNPWPPLYDLLVAGVARLLGSAPATVTTVLAWAGPVCGAACVLAIYAAARVLLSREASLGAAALYAAFHLPNEYGQIGNGDHHAFVAAIGAAWLALALRFVAPGARRLGWLGAGIAAARAATVLSWAGGLLYVVLADALLGATCVALGDRRRLGMFGASGLASAAVLAPFAATSLAVPYAPWASTFFSWLHVALAAALAPLALAALALESGWPARGAPGRLARFAAIGTAGAALARAQPPVRNAALGALRFLTMRDAAGAVTYEQTPLFDLLGRRALSPASLQFGWLAYLLPLAPLFAALRARDRGHAPPALLLAGWAGVLTALAVTQIRYGNDAAPAAAVCLACGLADAATLAARRVGALAARAAVALAAAAALVPSVAPLVRAAPASIAFASARLDGRGAGGAPLVATPTGTLVRFAEMVREATPETPGFLDDSGRPEWGILVNANLGHTLRYYAERPVAIDNFWDKFPSFAIASRFGDATDEASALAIARTLRARYVVTAAAGRPDHETVVGRLQSDDGRGVAGRAPLAHFRLVTEGPPHGRPITDLMNVPRPAYVIPYKLFEVVPGAVLAVGAAPGTPVRAEVTVRTPMHRAFTWATEAIAGADAVARLRVPYATGTDAPARATGPWRVRVGDLEQLVRVDDEAVRAGATVAVSTPAASRGDARTGSEP